MIAQAEPLLQRGSGVTRALLPAIFNILSQWKLSGAQQITLLGLNNEKTLYNWKGRPENARLRWLVIDIANLPDREVRALLKIPVFNVKYHHSPDQSRLRSN